MVLIMKNKIQNTFVVIGEKVKELHITEDFCYEAVSQAREIHLFSDIIDKRQSGKVKYKIEDLLMILLYMSIIGKCNSFTYIADYVEINKKIFIELGLIKDGEYPSHDTFRRVMMILEPENIEQTVLHRFHEFLLSLEHSVCDHKYHHYAIDGKVVRGSGRSNQSDNPKRNVNILNVYDTGLHLCCISRPVEDKTNEIPVAQELLKNVLNLKNSIVTADALHTCCNTANIIHEKKGKYVLPVKENNSSLLAEIKAKMEKYNNKLNTVKTDTRTFNFYHLPSSYKYENYQKIKTFVHMKSRRNKSEEIEMYFISNSADEDLIEYGIEKRWCIENDLHKEKDILLKEDSIHITDKVALNNLVILNNIAIAIYSLYGLLFPEKKKQMEKIFVQTNPIEAIKKIESVMNSDTFLSKVESLMKHKKCR